ncbi:MAG: AraC family transcriptional regulator [Clostridia bacterium]|nr:AraC family transcriptional regulator [Clostridia bacterium]
MFDVVYKLHSPHKLLKPYIHRIWIFESKYGIPNDDMKMITPNGEVKLIIMYRSNVNCRIENYSWDFSEHSFAIIGQTTKPAIIDPQGCFGTIGVEFRPFGAVNFFSIPLYELTNQFYHADEVLNRIGCELQKRIADSKSVEEKIFILESFLLNQLFSSRKAASFIEYAANQITLKNGVINISELITDTGYSKRHFDRKFKEHIGVSPKELARVLRFQAFYSKIAMNKNDIRDQMYDFYYDQSHFIKEFKRFTGLTPKEYFKQDNNFAKTFFEG